uniref:G-protein coupled receptors family 1 profile domain-containing protein n=1 Tax=Panagrolaimus sp. JU765 TaxID=591449 RepID=A0AC34RJ54_9BILA
MMGITPNESVIISNVIDSGRGLSVWLSVVIGLLLFILILFCVVGNLFVILAVILERELRSRPQYYLIFSLAVADLLVGLIVTPLGAWSTVKQAWPFGVVLCDFWISVDVLVCTSSILHLVAIALDRYWSITDIYYVQNRTKQRIFYMLLCIWVVSLLISLAPIFGWKDAQFVARVQEQHVCLISQQISYQVFSTATAFYIPLCAIIFVYYKIMRAAKKRFRRERDRRTINRTFDGSLQNKAILQKTPTKPPTVVFSQDGTNVTQENGTIIKINAKCDSNPNSASDDERTPIQCETVYIETSMSKNDSQAIKSETKKAAKVKKNKCSIQSTVSLTPKKKKRVKESIETRRERKAWRTLAIITGTFVACWTPFFLVSLYRPICGCHIPPLVESVTAWLGYLNSALNPIIYTLFSMDFRMAFQRIIKRLCFLKDF